MNILPNGLIKINQCCDIHHKHCTEIINIVNRSLDKITQNYFNEFIIMISGGSYNKSNCLSGLNNYNIKCFIIKMSEKFKIMLWVNIIHHMSDDELLKIIQNQCILIPNFINYLIDLDICPLNSSITNNFINIIS